MATYREGSMAAAEAKAAKRFKIGAAVVYALILAAIFVFKTDLKVAAAQAGLLFNLLGVALIAVSYYLIYRSDTLAKGAGYWAGVGVALVLGIFASVGFNL